MNFNIFLFFFSLIFCNSCQSAALNDDNEGSLLNVDVLYRMFQGLDLSNLLQMSKSNPTFNAVANEVFHKEYSDFFIYLYYYPRDTTHKVFKYEKRIEIYDGDFGLNILEQFGNSIKKLKFENRVASLYIESLQAANKFAAKSLEYLELLYARDETLAQFDRPFENVREFNCLIEMKPNGPVLPFNELFPRLRRLELALNQEVLGGISNGEYEHLEHLNLFILSEGTWEDIDEIELLLLNNPQIKSLGISNFPKSHPDFLRTIHELLPDIENLTVSDVFLKGDELRFDNVKHLFLTTHLKGKTPVTFPRLESIQYIFAEYNYRFAQEFLEDFKFKRMDIYAWIERDLDHPKLEQLLSEHSDLVELKLLFEDNVSTDVIIRIIQNQKSLQTFDFAIRLKAYDEEKVDIICAEFESEWEITKIGYEETHPGPQGFHMERKQTALLE